MDKVHIYMKSPVYRDGWDGRVNFGLIVTDGEDVAFFPEEAIPAFLAEWGKSSITVPIAAVETIPTVLLN